MSLVTDYFRELGVAIRDGWNRFWFAAVDPATLSLIRLGAGGMLFYTHFVWSLDLMGFFGPQARISPEFVRSFHDPLQQGQHFAWSYLHHVTSPAALWTLHILALLVFALLTVGCFTRVVSVLAFLITISYAHRVPGALFGLDQINSMLAMYLMIGPSGARYSVDRYLARRRGVDVVSPSISANVAIRLLQLHLCILYLFAGLGKLQGATWWEGSALWLAMANYEYQTIDVTWLGRWPFVINALTQFSVAWEISYPALVWPRLTRPLVIALAVPLHLGIGMCMGMMTFGVVMLIANLAFVSPHVTQHVVARIVPAARSEQGRGGKLAD